MGLLVRAKRLGHVEKVKPLIDALTDSGFQKQRRTQTEAIAAVGPDEPRVIVSTSRYLGEGFDDERLDTLFLTLPVSWRGTLAQYAGRLHRVHEGKRDALIYDYVDDGVPVLARMHARRIPGYKALGYEIIERASPEGQLEFDAL